MASKRGKELASKDSKKTKIYLQNQDELVSLANQIASQNELNSEAKKEKLTKKKERIDDSLKSKKAHRKHRRLKLLEVKADIRNQEKAKKSRKKEGKDRSSEKSGPAEIRPKGVRFV